MNFWLIFLFKQLLFINFSHYPTTLYNALQNFLEFSQITQAEIIFKCNIYNLKWNV